MLAAALPGGGGPPNLHAGRAAAARGVALPARGGGWWLGGAGVRQGSCGAGGCQPVKSPYRVWGFALKHPPRVPWLPSHPTRCPTDQVAPADDNQELHAAQGGRRQTGGRRTSRLAVSWIELGAFLCRGPLSRTPALGWQRGGFARIQDPYAVNDPLHTNW